jgi:methyl-accepting chemotaxis protein
MMFSSLPVLTSEGVGPISGSLMFGKFISADVIDEIAKLTHLSVKVFPYGSESSPADVINAEKSLTTERNQFVSPLSETTIAAYKILYDHYGKPLLTLKVETSREIYMQGKFTFSFFIISIGILFLVAGIILIALLERLVVSRFTKLEKTVQTISEKNDLAIRIKEDTKDEIGRLATSINSMLDKIVASEKAESDSSDKVRAISVELEKRLSETKRMNKLMVGRELKMAELKKQLATFREQK